MADGGFDRDTSDVEAVGGRDGRYPVVLRHFVGHPQRIVADRCEPV
jgi:hypothetical protein